jgi:hypothetical protein
MLKALLISTASLLLAACAGNTPTYSTSAAALPFYRCEQNLEFTARFIDDSVALDTSRGYDVLFKKKSGKPDEYDNARMSAEFNLGSGGKEAILRYPLLPLVLRCVKSN